VHSQRADAGGAGPSSVTAAGATARNERRLGLILGARRIGLLGGSFNPAHEGHRYISLLALKRLRLDEVWWVLTPQNPLKSARDTAPFEERLKAAKRVARHPRIRVTDIERRLGTAHTADTLALLLRRFPKCRFVWLMGADNLVQISEWKDWRRIFRLVPIAVFSRPPYSKLALVARAARVFAEHRVAESRARSILTMSPPAWVFLHTRPHAGSATRIRARRAAAAIERADERVAIGQR
jgi:nicotinate-nucleotide adenylyltransferase